MPGRLIDCSQKAVKAGTLTQEEADFVRHQAKDLGKLGTMSSRDAEVAAVRSLVNDGIAQLRSIRNQLGKSDPIKESKILYRTTNKEAAMAAMMDETQAIIENKMLAQTKALQGDQGKMMAAEQVAEGEMLGAATAKPQVDKTSAMAAAPERSQTTPRPVDRQAEIMAAVDRLNKKPEERVGVYQKMRDRVHALMQEHKLEIGRTEFKEGLTIGSSEGLTTADIKAQGIKPESLLRIDKQKMLSAMGELNALLKFLPAEVRGKVGGFFQLAQGGVGETELANFFTQRVTMIEREMERLLKRDYLGQITELLGKKTKPVKSDSGVLKSKIGDAQVAADIAREVMAMEPDPNVEKSTVADTVAAKLAELESSLTNPDLSPDEQSNLQYRWAITNLFGDIAHASAETMAAAHAWLQDTVARGRSEWGIKEESRLEKVRAWSAEIEAGLPEVGQAGVSATSRPVSALQWLNSFDLEHYSFAQFMQHILPEGASMVKRWQDASRRADNATQDDQIAAGDRMTERLKSDLSTSSRMKIGAASKLLMKEETLTKGGKPYTVTRLDAVQYILSWSQPGVREKMQKQKLPWKQEDIDQLVALTSDEVSQSAMGFLRDEYSKGHSIVNPVYKRMNGMDLPSLPNYAPTRYHNAGIEQELSMFGGPVSTSGVTPSFLHGRVNHSAIIRQENALTVYWQHMTQQSHYVHFAELIREMRGVLRTPDVKLAIEQKYGKHVVQDVSNWIDALARQGGNKAAELGTINSVLTSLLGAKAIASMGLNLKSIMNQFDSTMRVSIPLPPKRIIAALLDPQFGETIPLAWKSDTIQRRVRGGASPEVRYLYDQARTNPGTMLKLSRISMLPLQWIDGRLTSFSAAIVYRDSYNEAIAQGMDIPNAEEYAADQMDEAVSRYSQPVGLASKSLIEVSGNRFAKIFMMFISDMRLKTALISQSVRSIVKNPADGAAWRQLIAVEGFALAAKFFQNMYRDIFTDDDEDDIWGLEGFALAMATAPLSGYVMVGTAAQFGISIMAGQKAWVPSRDPLVEATQRIPAAAKHLDQTFNFDDRKAMLREWDNLARSIAVTPTLAAPSVIVNALKPVIGAIENAEKED